MTFRAQVAADRSAVFLRAAEFGETIEVDGVSIVAVLDDEARSPRGSTLSGSATVDGVYVSESVLHVRKEDLEYPPAIGQRMTVAGRQANVAHVAEAMGMLAIRLHWYES